MNIIYASVNNKINIWVFKFDLRTKQGLKLFKLTLTQRESLYCGYPSQKLRFNNSCVQKDFRNYIFCSVYKISLG